MTVPSPGVRTVALAGFVLLVLILAGTPVSPAPAVSGPRTGGSATPALASEGPLSLARPGAANCSLAGAHYQQLFPGTAVPPGVPNSTFAGCPIGADDAALSLLSSANGSASNVTFSLTLPLVGSPIGTAYAMFSLRLAVSGVPCSLGGASVLEVQLIPPWSPLVGALDPNWTLRTPAFDLAPPASCDAHCSNDTALVSLDGAAFCEDEFLPDGLVSTPGSGFAPGASLQVVFRGSVGGGAGLALWVNDTARPAADVAKQFNAVATSIARPLDPLTSAAGSARSLWDGAGAVSAAWTDCPLPTGPSLACTSYEPSLDALAGSIAVTNATYGAGAVGAFYSQVATSSTTAGCTAASPACVGFSSVSASAYPSWWLSSHGGAAAFQFGNGPGAGPATFGGAAGQFGGGGSAGFLPIDLVANGTSVQLTKATVSATYLDFAGISNTTFQSDYCSTSSTPSVVTVPGLLVGGSETDGTWNATWSLSGGPFHGSYPIADALGLANNSTLYAGGLTSFSVAAGAVCTFPTTTSPTIVSIAPTALGYRVVWNDTGAFLRGFQVNVSAGVTLTTSVPQTWAGAQNGTVTAVVPAPVPAGSMASVNVSALGLDGTGSAPSTTVTGPAVFAALDLNVTAAPTRVVATGPTLFLNLTLAGGLPPYDYSISLGNGGPTISGALAATGTVGVSLGSYQGTLDVRVTVRDAAGDVTGSGTLLVAVAINPLAPPQSSEAGDGFVSISWGSAPAFAGDPVLGFFVYTTPNASDAWRIASEGVVAGSYGDITVTYTTNHSASFRAGDGTALFAQVVALAATGIGALPSGNATLVGRPAPFSVGDILSVGGGVAPFNDNFTASVTGGSNDTILSATFSFPGFVEVPATIVGANGSYLVSASYEFFTPGTFAVTLHVTDSVYDVGVVTTTVFVAPGLPPTLTASVLNGPSYNGTPVVFQATATGGSGSDAFSWSFGDGATSNLSSPVHVYALPGTYSAVVRATDTATQGSNTTVLPVTIFTAPVVYVSVFPGPNGTDSFDFRASVGGGSGPSQIVWSFGDGTLAHGANVTHDYEYSGAYVVNVTATDPAGHSGSTEYPLGVQRPTSGGGGGTNGIAPSDFWLVVILATAVIVVLAVIALRPRPPPVAEPIGDFEEEDGAVSLR